MPQLRFHRSPAAGRFLGLVALCGVLCALASGFDPAPSVEAAGPSSRNPRNSFSALKEQHDELIARLGADLDTLLFETSERNAPEASARIREVRERVDGRVLDDTLPRALQTPLAASTPLDERYVSTRLSYLQEQYAQDLYRLAQRAIQNDYPGLAYKLVQEVALHNPDHKQARRLLGYVQYGTEWVTPFEAKMLGNRQEWHDRFGWLPRGHAERYDRGERYFNGRFISATKEAAIRRDFRYAWQVRTEHFLIKTNYSLERGVELGKALEDFHRFFFQTFAGFFNTPDQMQNLFDGAPGNTRYGTVTSQPMQVHYYVDRDEYIAKLKDRIPLIAATNGLYLTGDRTAYFFHNPDPDADNDATVFHEATHQLFYESQRRDRMIASDANFWIIEGIACYMESFGRENGHFSIGDPDYVRFAAARYRLLNDSYYIPFEEFSRMGMDAFQRAQNLQMNYSQASGLAHFFMHYDEGRYREALVEHLAQIYRGTGRVQTLEELTGVPFAELDRQYAEHIASFPE